MRKDVKHGSREDAHGDGESERPTQQMDENELLELVISEPEPSDAEIEKELAEEQPTDYAPQRAEVGRQSGRGNPMKTFEIMFGDLNEEAQRCFLEFRGLEKPEDGNLGIVPIAIVELEDDSEREGGQQ